MEAHALGFHPVVYNYGTVGSCNKDLQGLGRVTRVIQRDMNAEPQAPVSYTHLRAHRDVEESRMPSSA